MGKADTDQRMRAYFEQAYGKRLSDAEVTEYKNRLVKFFSLLIEIDRRENVTKTYDSKIISLLVVVITQNDSSRWIDKQKTEIEKSWHQTWWGILILTVLGEIIGGLLLHFMGII